jgi:uncharacterized membrane protein
MDMSITPRHCHFLLLTISLLWCGSILSFPFLLHSAHPLLASGIFLVFAKICHQDPARSFWFGGVPLPVCARCTAVYLGFLGAVSFWPLLKRIAAKGNKLQGLLMAAVVLMTVDAGLDFVGVRNSTLATRTLTGSLLGVAVGWIISSIATRKNSSLNQTVNYE